MKRFFLALLAGFGWLVTAAPPSATGAEATPRKQVDFIREVQPIFKQSCYSCHGPEKKKASLRLDSKTSAFKGGENGPPIVPGHAEKSLLMERLLSTNPDERMPQKADPLSPEQITLIRDWINQGALWPEAVAGIDPARHWAFQPLGHVMPPKVQDTSWIRTPVDNFILARLEEKQSHPNPSADPRTLIRRAYFDLVGLPPAPDEVDDFVRHYSAETYLRLIDRLLASPHYGERWARHWMDAVRFGESHGFEQDYDRPFAYWYRDFVIKALNDDMPYDQFIQWQLAGDEFAPDNPWAMAATGFVGAGVFPTQLTEAEFEPARYDELDNMAATTGTAMLGLTIGCARCHDHKFDPIPAKDYYRFISIFARTIRSEVDLDFEPGKYQMAKAKFDAEHAPLVAARDRFEKEELPRHFNQWLQDDRFETFARPTWTVLDLDEVKSKEGAILNKLADGSVLASAKNPDHDTFTFVGHVSFTNISALRIEALADSSLPKNGPGRADNGNIQLTDLRVTAAPLSGEGAPLNLRLTNPKATFEQSAELGIAKVIDDDPRTGWAVDPRFGTNHAAAFEVEKGELFQAGTKLTFTLTFNGNVRHTIGRTRIAVASASVPPALTAEGTPQSIVEIFSRRAVAPQDAPWDETERKTALAWYRTLDPDWQKLERAVQDHLKSEPKQDLKKVMVTSEGFKPLRHHADERGFPHFYPTTYFLKRGDTRQKGEEMKPGFLQILSHAPEGEQHWMEAPPPGNRTSWRRRALANWITDTRSGAGDLLARVAVNRLWQHHFGNGIVATPNDFGTQGARPSNPELLDWLAGDLEQHHWNLKRLHKLIMTSSTYLQGTDQDEARTRIDPDNQLLWRRERHRLEAEVIRDSMLSVSGLLEEGLFGPGTLDEGMHRRSIYFFVKRSKVVPILQLFDAPDPSVSVGSRVSTTIAPQALLFMNNPHVREYARALSRRLEPAAEQSLATAVEEGYRITLGRRPDAQELEASTGFLEHQRQSYRDEAKAKPQELALVDFCQVLFGLNEFIYVE